MPYTSQQELEDRFSTDMLIRLTDRGTPAAGIIDPDVVAEVLEDTDAMIDGYVAAKYALPMAEVPPLINALAKDIVIYKLHTYDPDPKIKEDYKAAIKSLERISAGSIRLPLAGAAAGSEAGQTGTSGARVTDRPRPFTADSLKGLI